MNALDTLKFDHDLIGRVLDALEVFAEKLEKHPETGREELKKFNTFFQEFVAMNHHEMEETILMPVLESHGFRWSGGTLERLRTDHQHEDGLLESLEHAALHQEQWSSYEQQALQFLLKEFIQFSRTHIRRENADLIEAARTRIPPEAMAALDAAATRFLDEQIGEETRFKMIGLALELVSTYPRVAPPTTEGGPPTTRSG